MPLPAPNLDDRRFQDFVDDAKRLVQRRIPAWTDHNVHDPGVTLIEAVATIADQLGYRFNQVPERHYRKFLDLLGITLRPPAAARSDLTFRLSAPRPEPVLIPAGTAVATRRLPGEEQVSFTTLKDLTVVPVELSELRTASVAAGDTPSQLTDLGQALEQGERVACFTQTPQPGERLYVGLSAPAPSCLVLLRTDSAVEGIGVNPDQPPLRWEAFTGSAWTQCEVMQDTTGGLNKPGDILLQLPEAHAASLINGIRAAWVRAVVTEPAPGQPGYTRTPMLSRLSAASVGGTVTAIHADRIVTDLLGEAEGSPGQQFPVSRKPMLASADTPVLEVSQGEGWEEWACVPDFASSGRDDPHFRVDYTAGVVELGPAVRRADGSMYFYGRVPPEGAMLRLREYWSGGGSVGNVPAGTLCVLRTPIPYVKSVTNGRPAAGGREGETVDEAKVRAGATLRTCDRAVTTEDYEVIASEAAHGAARVRCVAPTDATGVVRVLVVPDVAGYGPGRLPFPALTPDRLVLQRIAGALDKRRLVGTRVAVEPPHYRGVTIAVRLRARRGRDCDRLREDALAALYRWLHPRDGGSDGSGWPFGRPVTLGDVHAAMAGLADLDYVEEARLYPADPATGARSEAASHIEVGPDELPFSFDHQVQVRP
ncbi:MAG TPA: putative baseplate assembly protein [Streptosporangiaceae bacterium]|nr:putative baseplate assembly protein [Streptosporangiaceae bacterium]